MHSYPIYFFSDAHLGATTLGDDRDRETQLIRFLEYAAANQGEIYIVGDLFEFWFEYREVIPNRNFRVLATFYHLTRQGCKIHYLPGNHDLWIGSFLRQELGLVIHGGATEVKTQAYNIFVIHGDGMARSDRGYRFLKKIFTHPVNIFLYRWIHPDLGIPFAKKMSHVSRAQGEQKKDPFEQEYRIFVQEKFSQGYDIVIMGHTHKPVHEIYGSRHYINLGDWIDHFSYCELDENGPVVRQWPSQRVYVEPIQKQSTETVSESRMVASHRLD